ncbi:MAG: hypothetical protein HYY23_19065 [Verrucomicrobia bacterium]|nr:hypothetical protein [Verrucomicrobiota bacterium]
MKPICILSILALTFVLAEATPCGAQQYNFTTFAGSPSGAGFSDGTGSAARFRWPTGIAADSAGNIFVADTWNHTIRKTTPGGVVSTVAGLAGERGSADGMGRAARFDAPHGVAVDSAGYVYVADFYDSTIRKITPDGVVSTLAGLAYKRGNADGTGANARFAFPFGLALDSAGNVYVADSDNATIRKITPDGVVSTLAGLAGGYGRADGTGSVARFNSPAGVALDSAGNVYVADSGNNTIRKITPGGAVTTLAGLAGNKGSVDGMANDARFAEPRGITVDGAGNIYVADRYPTIRKITPAGVMSTLAGLVGHWGSADGTGSVARFSAPAGLAVDAAGNVYVADGGDSTIRKITPVGVVSTLAGLAGGYPGDTDGIGSAARFALPTGVAVDSAGNVYVGDSENHAIRKITPGGVVSTLAGLAGFAGSADGTGANARFASPLGVAVDNAGNVYVADSGNSTIRKITPGGVVSTLAGLAGTGGSADGTGSAARFAGPRGVTVDSSGNVYVADTYNQTIRKITSGGIVSTLAGLPGHPGSADGTGSAARFGWPFGVAVDKEGNVYVADTENNMIRKVTPSGLVSTLAGQAGSSDSDDGMGSDARFGWPTGVAVDSAGNVYVAEGRSLAFEQGLGHATIRKITPAGVVSTLAGLAWNYGSDDGTGSTARFTDPTGVAVDSAGNIYVTDTAQGTVRLGKAVLVTQPLVIANSLFRLADGQFQFEVTAATNQLVLIQAASKLPTTNWNTIQIVTLWNGRSTIIDPGAADFPLRFYRVLSPVP